MTSTPIIIIDTREQSPLFQEGRRKPRPKTEEEMAWEFSAAYPTKVETLPVGDYGIEGFSDWNNPRFIVERKSIDDLVGSLIQGSERFTRLILKMRQFQWAAILVEATRTQVERGEYYSKAHPNCVLAKLDAIVVRNGIHVIWGVNKANASRRFEGLVRQFLRGVEKDARRIGFRAATKNNSKGE